MWYTNEALQMPCEHACQGQDEGKGWLNHYTILAVIGKEEGNVSTKLLQTPEMVSLSTTGTSSQRSLMSTSARRREIVLLLPCTHLHDNSHPKTWREDSNVE